MKDVCRCDREVGRSIPDRIRSVLGCRKLGVCENKGPPNIDIDPHEVPQIRKTLNLGLREFEARSREAWRGGVGGGGGGFLLSRLSRCSLVSGSV